MYHLNTCQIVYQNFYKNDEDDIVQELVYTQDFVDHNSDLEIIGRDSLETKVSYFIGGDKSKWKGDIQTVREVVYKNIYDGIDLVFKFQDGAIKYEYIIAPGVNSGKVKFSFNGIDGVGIDKEGNLIIKTPLEDFVHLAPYVYQNIDGEIVKIISSYQKDSDEQISFSVENYNSVYELVIDPVLDNLDISTFLGGTSVDYVESIDIDSSGYIYVAGITLSSNFPTTTGVLEITISGGYDFFISKFDAELSSCGFYLYRGKW